MKSTNNKPSDSDFLGLLYVIPFALKAIVLNMVIAVNVQYFVLGQHGKPFVVFDTTTIYFGMLLLTFAFLIQRDISADKRKQKTWGISASGFFCMVLASPLCGVAARLICFSRESI